MFDEYTLFFVPQKVGISYKVKKNQRANFGSGGGYPPNVVTMDEMTMAQYKIIRFHNTMVATDFQQKFDIRRKK